VEAEQILAARWADMAAFPDDDAQPYPRLRLALLVGLTALQLD
jgi:hypothetical protein